MAQIILATDPGKNGATVIKWPDGKLNSWSWGGEAEFVDLVQHIQEAMIDYTAEWYVEQPPKTTGMKRPESTGFVLGENFGFIKGAVMAGGIRMHLVRPQAWQSMYSGMKGKAYKERKDLCWEEAKRLFPSPTKVTKKNADAWLILNYAQHK